MKKLTVILFIVMISCGPSREEIEARDKYVQDSTSSVMIQAASIPAESNSTPVTKMYNNNADFSIGLYQVNGCEYLRFTNQTGFEILHAGNCDNPIHKQKVEELSLN